MIRNYITVAIRNLLRDKLTTAINVLGLSVAVATTILLGIGVQALLTGDGEFPGSDRLFRIITREVHGKGGVSHRAWQRPDLAEALAGTFPEVESTTRVVRTDILMAVGEQHGFQEVIEVDESFLRMFDLSTIAGHDATDFLASTRLS